MARIWNNPGKNEWYKITKRPTVDQGSLDQIVREIFQEVEISGDSALAKYTLRFDGINVDRLEVSKEEIQSAGNRVDDNLKDAINLAKTNITKFHEAQVPIFPKVTTSSGVTCWMEERPIENIGIYIPGGSAPLFSSVLMLAIPARIAGCNHVTMCTPSNRNGKIDDVILYTADLCGVNQIFKVGGIQAIAAMGIGTETIASVDKIFGPGNQYVTAAKQYVQNYQVAIDLPAGPSEVLVLADQIANPSFVASDLLAQAEHGTDSQVVFVTTEIDMIDKVAKEVSYQLNKLPRKDIASKSIEHMNYVWFPDKNTCIDFANTYAPEHLIICVKDQNNIVNKISNAGSVFIGNFSPESAGDYATGTNHTLPTNGYARQFSGVNLSSFKKTISFQKLSKEGLRTIGSAVIRMAEAEGLKAHANSIALRLKQLKD